MGEILSVVIPVYKVEPYLRQCLDSIVNQTYKDLEIILVDDGSPDGCGAICDAYAAKDDRIIVIHKENAGLSAARNDGIRRATGEWIAFVDSDDWLAREYYEKMFSALGRKNVDVFCAGGYFLEEDGDSKIVHHSVDWEHADWAYDHPQSLLPDVLLQRRDKNHRPGVSLCMPWDKIYRTSFLKEHQLIYDESIKACEDVLFNFKVFYMASKVGGCACIGYHYRQVPSSIGHGFNPNKPQINYGFVTKLYEFISCHEVDDAVVSAVGEMAVTTISYSLSCYYFHPNNTKTWAEVSREIAEMTNWPLYHKALYSNDNRYATAKRLVLKYSLRYGRGWVLRVLYMMNQAAK